MYELFPDNLTAFLVPEVTPGTPVPPSGADAIPLREGLSFPTQPQTYTKIKEALRTRSTTALMLKAKEPGTVTLPCYPRPSGAAGTPPAEGPLLKALKGAETIVPATSVTYGDTLGKTAQTLWVGLGSGLLFVTGLLIHGLKAKQGEEGPPELDFEGTFQRLGWGGETTLGEDLAGGETDLDVADAAAFAVGCPVAVGTSAGHQITAVDYAAGTLTVTPAVVGAQLTGVTVAAELPEPVLVGSVLAERAAVTVNGAAIRWKGWELTVAEPVGFVSEVPEDPTAEMLPGVGVARAGREVSATVEAVMRATDFNRLRAVNEDRPFSLDFSHAAAGSRLVIGCAQGRYQVPELSSGDPTVVFKLGYDARASGVLEDESTFTYT